jgi:phosphoserine aminotransferase
VPAKLEEWDRAPCVRHSTGPFKLDNPWVRSGGFYRGHSEPGWRSLMNVTFRLPGGALEKQFITAAQAAGMVGLAGHRSVGGIRASIYNAVSPEA